MLQALLNFSQSKVGVVKIKKVSKNHKLRDKCSRISLHQRNFAGQMFAGQMFADCGLQEGKYT